VPVDANLAEVKKGLHSLLEKMIVEYDLFDGNKLLDDFVETVLCLELFATEDMAGVIVDAASRILQLQGKNNCQDWRV
jgi:hypothetical protein